MTLSFWLKNYSKKFLRKGKLFNQIFQQLIKNEKLSYEELIDYQNQMLCLNLQQAYQAVPYYKKLFDDLDLNPQDIKTIQDLQYLPILNKSQIRGQEQQFVSQDRRWKFQTATSGTTGTSVKLFRNYFSINLEHAFLWRQKYWANCFAEEKTAVLKGEVITPAEAQEPPFWRYTPDRKKLLMSSYHLSERLIPYYLEELRNFSPSVIEGFPSCIYRLAHYMKIHQQAPIKVKAVFTSSETLQPYQRQAIEKCFGTIFDHYGQSERVAHIAMCEHGNYHYAMDYGVIEFLPTNEDDLYKVVGTSLYNVPMPFIRYDTGDLVRIKDFHQSCPCGRAFPIIESIEGRQEDYLVTPSGKWVGAMGRVFLGVSNLIECQIIQEKLDLIRVLIVTTDKFSDRDRDTLLNNIHQRIGNDINIIIQKTDTIPRTIRGKQKITISLLQETSYLTNNLT